MNAAATTDFALTAQQAAFFRIFGFVRLPGLFADDIDRITRGFEEAFASESSPTVLDPRNPFHESRDERYAEKVREMVPYFIERSEDLRWLRDDPRIVNIATTLIGPDYQYADSDGNRFNCDVKWHIDAYGSPIGQFHIKCYFYLDALDASNGALRVIPGTCHHTEAYAQGLYRDLMVDPASCEEIFGVPVEEIPSWTIPVQPGDLVVGNYRTLHGSFHGAPGRRLFTVNFKEPGAG